MATDQRFNHLRQYGRDVLSLLAPSAEVLQTRVQQWQLSPPGEMAARGEIDRSRSFSPGFEQWPFAVSYGLAYFALLFGFMLWLAPWAGTLLPPPSTIPRARQTLRARLLALQKVIPSLQLEPAEQPDELLLSYTFRAGKRSIKMRLRLDAERGRVVAKEYTGVEDDAPITASEARMRVMHHRSGAMVHPQAFLVFSSNWSVSMPTAAKRQPLGVWLLGDAVQLPPQTIEHFTDDSAAGAEDLPSLLAEIVHQSGWEWRGVFIF